MLTPTYLTASQSEECPQADHTLFEPYYKTSLVKQLYSNKDVKKKQKTSHYPLQVGTHSFEGTILL